MLPGSSRDMAAKLLGRFLTRPDTGDALSNFLQWCEETGESDHRIATFLVPGESSVIKQQLPEFFICIWKHDPCRCKHFSDIGTITAKACPKTKHIAGQLQTMCDIAGNSSQDVIKRILPHLWSKARQLGQSDMVKRSAKTR